VDDRERDPRRTTASTHRPPGPRPVRRPVDTPPLLRLPPPPSRDDPELDARIERKVVLAINEIAEPLAAHVATRLEVKLSRIERNQRRARVVARRDRADLLAVRAAREKKESEEKAAHEKRLRQLAELKGSVDVVKAEQETANARLEPGLRRYAAHLLLAGVIVTALAGLAGATLASWAKSSASTTAPK